jgi:N-methylhydantoinase B
MKKEQLDIITFEVIRNSFNAICDEAGRKLERVAYTNTIHEGRDYSVAIVTGDVKMVTHGMPNCAPHLGTFESKINALTQVWDPSEMKAGDVFLWNDPYSGGTHQNDMAYIRPVFIRNEIFAYAINLGHMPDAGGPIPGSFNPKATTCYEEGLRIPGLKLYEKDKPVKATFELLKQNIRAYIATVGDIYAQYQAGLLIERRLKELIGRYGKVSIEAAFRRKLETTAMVFREKIRELPDGVYEFSDYGDEDVMAPEKGPIKVTCVLTIKGSDLTMDFSKSDSAPISSWGFPRAALLSASYCGTMFAFPELGRLDNGVIRSIKIISKPNTCVDVQAPTPQSGYCSGAYEKVLGSTLGCWNKVFASAKRPEKIHAPFVNLENVCIGGIHPETGREYVAYLWLEGGGGASGVKDGVSYRLGAYIGGSTNQPLEVHERWYPVMYERVESIRDSCGDGKFRGGFGIYRDVRARGDIIYTIHGDREKITPYGVAGGTNGGPNKLILNPGTPAERNIGMFGVGINVKPGDYVLFGSNGGGGFGNPLERHPNLVCEDVSDELISTEKAREVYGVSIVKEEFEYKIDWEETNKLRRDASQKTPKVGYGPGECNPHGLEIKVKG